MSTQTGMMGTLLVLAACTVPPQQTQEEPVVLPVIVVEDTRTREAPEPPKPKPEKKQEKKPEDRKADKLCPPTEGETDNQRIIRKLDCLIERT